MERETSSSADPPSHGGNVPGEPGEVRSRFRVAIPRTAVLVVESDRCCCCERAVARRVSPARTASTFLQRVPAITLPVCRECLARLRRRSLADAAAGAAEAGVATIVLGGCVALWPWVPAIVLVCASTAGAVLGWLGFRAMASRTGLRQLVREDAPAVWVAADRATATLEVCSVRLGEELASGAGGRVLGASTKRTLGVWQAAALVAAVLLLPWLTLRLAFDTVRVIHVSPSPLEIFVDGRSLGIVIGVEGEDPTAMREFRVPRGTRTFEARGLDGATVDRTTAVVGEGAAQLYIPFRGEQCFWVEQRSYGQSARRASRVLPLGARGAFVTLSDPVDSWFEANPEPASDGRWFSGGTRTAVRHGACAAVPRPGG